MMEPAGPMGAVDVCDETFGFSKSDDKNKD
jgi:hypothetical protein